MSKLRHAFFIVLSLFISACKYPLLDPKGIIASDEKHIMLTAILLMLIVVIPVILLTFTFAWHYRANNTKATYAPEWAHSTFLEIIWWSIPCIIIGILAYITWTSSFRLDPYKPLASTEKPLQIEVIALEWKWLFIYPDEQIATTNFIEFPKDVPIEFLITAEGPMNSFQIPQLGGQIYAMAGMQTKLHLITDQLGEYAGVSANFSGDGFSEMKFNARAVTKQEFNRWVKEVKQSDEILSPTTYQKLAEASVEQNVKYFASANRQIFANVIMKAMMPMTMTG